MRDINDILPRIPDMKWGALMNRPPTHDRVDEMNRIFPDNGRWHTVFEEGDQVVVDGRVIRKKDPSKWS
ncbi:MAG: hypothetical protein MPJ05_07955 [Nitrosopumilus sp.]|nr:hypothetical protein [Nitrosopumilus sp.]MDA7953727.1 hypothetical protein [Nitrosopumilus sp.]MDA7955346.1 hypothetical protein [Nitrosopumilus sp.]MDA7960651.1 hypothetical protein [Nitrosopumilus sp.]